ncbi:hypothetical protein LJB98_00575 [Bacteroidales bacterium OttesenSCG-928-M11]|nr:hypothetical protein [Bacteroidales bacterium OttesenSCG-928-M11]
MKKEKYRLEYVFDKASRNTLWGRIATPSGLAEWFADDVKEASGNIYAFCWNKYIEEAEIVSTSYNNYIRYRWLESEDPDAFFEFRLSKVELTGATSLEITDFAEPSEKLDAIALWDSEISVLRRVLGIL